jgi:hypothetical protein
MNSSTPPRIATWMMQHLSPSDCDEAPAGDLLEEYRAGRSAGWYWLQVIAAIAVSWRRSIWRRRAPLFFAAMWSFLSPAWLLMRLRYYERSRFIGGIWELPWPWSTICHLLLSLAVDMLFIWIGALVYVTLCRVAFGRLGPLHFGRAILSSTLVCAIAIVCDIAIALMIVPHANGAGVDWRTLTLIGVLGDFGFRPLLLDLPFFAGLAGALWHLSPRRKTSAGLAA